MRYVLLGFSILFIGAGCAVPKVDLGSVRGVKPTPSVPSVLERLEAQSVAKRFSSEDELRAFLREQGEAVGGEGAVFGSRGTSGIDMMAQTFGTPASLSTEAAVDSGFGGAGVPDFSRTNVQVTGVDEADIIKTDGTYVYALVRNTLHIIEARPADKARELSKIEFTSRPQNLYIEGDRLVVFGQDQEFYSTQEERRYIRRNPYTFFKVFDITDKHQPEQIRDLRFEGVYTNSRMIDDHVYFVTTNYNYYYFESEPLLPRVLDGQQELSLAPDIYYFDIPYNSYNFTAISAINVQDVSAPITSDIYLMDAAQNMYVSRENIYLTYTKYLNEYELTQELVLELIYPRLPSEDQGRIREIQAVPNYILNKQEKSSKITSITERYIYSLSEDEIEVFEQTLEEGLKQKFLELQDELEQTVIHKIAIDAGDISYLTQGEVPGTVLNQFSMDEYEGMFRIATTRDARWWRFVDDAPRESVSNLYVMDEDLDRIGAVEGLAKGERIYSVRFIGERAYLVTFEQVDPLFVIDLADPRTPRVLGELKIPGFSNYLHPYDEHHLIGIGKDTTVDEHGRVRTKGVKLSLFDVRDVQTPKEVDVYTLGEQGSSSIAEHDHRAFLFSKDRNLLVIPVSLMESRPSPDGTRVYPQFTFSGSVVFALDEGGFELRGRVDHSNGGSVAPDDYWNGYSYYDNTVRRNFYIEDVLYTFSNRYLKMHDLADLHEVRSIDLSPLHKGEDVEVIPTPFPDPGVDVMF